MPLGDMYPESLTMAKSKFELGSALAVSSAFVELRDENRVSGAFKSARGELKAIS